MYLNDTPGDYAIGCALIEPEPEPSLDDKIGVLGLDYTGAEDRNVKKATTRHRRDISRHRAMRKEEVRRTKASARSKAKVNKKAGKAAADAKSAKPKSIKRVYLPGGEPLRRPKYLGGQERTVTASVTRLRRADRRQARTQCDAAKYDDKIVVTGSLIAQRASVRHHAVAKL